MRKSRLFLSLIFSIILTFSLCSCGSAVQGDDSVTEIVTQQSGSLESAEDPEIESSDIMTAPADEQITEEAGDERNALVVYFSATGTTKEVAEKIAELEGADIYEIVPAQGYTSEDLNYHDPDSRASVEQSDESIRPEIGSEPIALSGYERIYIGYPIWFAQEPRIMDTFVESNDFGDATVIPFCTSGSSGIGQSGKNLEENAGSGNWVDGQRFGASVSEEDLQSWIDGLQ